MGKKLMCAGVGQLNSRVAKQWMNLSGQVVGLRRSAADISLPFEQFMVNLAHEDWPDLDADIVVVALSAQERTVEGYRAAYLEPIERLAKSLSSWHKLPEKVIVVSSTRVFGVEDGSLITDAKMAETANEFGEILLAMEHAVHALPVPSTVARLSGIYGPGRDWLKRSALAADEEAVTKNHWTNRIHIDDAASAIIFLMQLNTLEPSYIVSDLKPMPLLDMYAYFREREGLHPLQFEMPPAGGKRLIPTRLQALGFTWEYPHAFAGGYD